MKSLFLFLVLPLSVLSQNWKESKDLFTKKSTWETEVQNIKIKGNTLFYTDYLAIKLLRSEKDTTIIFFFKTSFSYEALTNPSASATFLFDNDSTYSEHSIYAKSTLIQPPYGSSYYEAKIFFKPTAVLENGIKAISVLAP